MDIGYIWNLFVAQLYLLKIREEENIYKCAGQRQRSHHGGGNQLGQPTGPADRVAEIRKCPVLLIIY